MSITTGVPNGSQSGTPLAQGVAVTAKQRAPSEPMIRWTQMQQYLDLKAGPTFDVGLEFLRAYASEQRPLAWLHMWTEGAHRNASDPTFLWRLVAAEWAGFDCIPYADFATAFAEMRREWTPDIMSTDDRSHYDALSPVLTVYRGQDASRRLGLSWSLRRDTAVGFAIGHRGIWHTNPVITRRRIQKSKIAFFVSARSATCSGQRADVG
jgi:hypothetical protein